MIIGSGLIASAMRPHLPRLPAHCIYAAGVSNSACKDSTEFDRERRRLCESIEAMPAGYRLVYFGTCSVADPCAVDTPYVQHKLAMESLALQYGDTMIFRLPQVVGPTLNPHTLTNYLIARIARSERFTIWRNARRHLIDVTDMASIVTHLLVAGGVRNQIVNIASPVAYSVFEIVAAMERLIGKPAHYDIVDRGADYALDTRVAEACAAQLGIDFGPGYLERALERTYGRSADAPTSTASSETP